VEGLDVLPVLLEERDKEVDAQHNVSENLVVSHLDVANGDTEAENLLQLELDGGSDLVDLVGKIFGVRHRRREFTSLRETGSEKTGNLLDEGLRGEESVILLGKFLDKFLVLVELLQIVNRHVFKLNLLRTIDVSGIGENANGHARAGDIGELDSSRETLVPLGIVVLQTNLQLDGLNKVALFLAIGFYKEFLDGAPHA